MKKTIKDFELKGKTVIIRCDLNVPMIDGTIEDDTRIRSSLRTIKFAIDASAKVILLSHLGRVKKDADKITNSLYPVSIRLSKYLGREVLFSYDTRSDVLTKRAQELKEKDILLIENTRFEDLDGNKESSCDLELAKYWSSLGDIFINDAYGSCHRRHASIVGIPQYLPSGIGFLVDKELKKIDAILNSKTHPFIVILGGKKIEDKITLIERLLEKCDKLLIGGAMSFPFLKTLGYDVVDSLNAKEYQSFCQRVLKKYADKIVLPSDFLTSRDNQNIEIKNINDISGKDIGYDIGPKTIKRFEEEIKKAKRVVINGPMGIFEDKRFAHGTSEIFKVLDKNKIKTLVGGGDTASAANSLGYASSFYHISTGGGATLKYLEDGKLVGIEAIDDKE